MAETKKFVDAALKVPCTPDTFIRTWFELLQMNHRLSEREKDVAAQLVAHWRKLRKKTDDEEILNRALFSKKERNDIREELGLSPQRFRNILLQLRQSGIIRNGRLNPQYIPKYTEGTPFRLMFIIDDAGTPGKNNK